MPRPRRYNPDIPRHIDQSKLPVGCYWNPRDHYWYTIIREPKPHRQRLAGPEALMSELHAAMELVRGVDLDSLDWMLGKFEASAKFEALAPSTQRDYRYCRDALKRFKTRVGVPFAELRRAQITLPAVQALVDAMARRHPTKANHVKRYLSSAYAWAMRRGYADSNPAKGVAQARERAAHRMPTQQTLRRVLAFLRARGALPARARGALPDYLWPAAQIAYRCRMRGIEVVSLTDADAADAGIIVRRRKGSRDNVTRWCPELREAWQLLASRRDQIRQRRRTPTPMRAEDRHVFVSESGDPLRVQTLRGAWGRAMLVAVAADVLEDGDRFGLHGLKHRGVTDTEGDKARASGHRSARMLQVYDHELPVVDPAGTSGNGV